MSDNNYEVTIAKLKALLDDAHNLAWQMLVVIVLLSAWCTSLVYTNCKLEDKYEMLAHELLVIVNTHE